MGLFTATLRPLSGEPFAELVERAGNFGTPFALLLLVDRGMGLRTWYRKIRPPVTVQSDRMYHVLICLSYTAFSLLAGHGLLNLIGKKSLLEQYASLGFHKVHLVGFCTGLIEIAAAMLILLYPSRLLLVIAIIWKMSTELFYPHWELAEWVERGCSYGTLLAIWFALPRMNVGTPTTYVVS